MTSVTVRKVTAPCAPGYEGKWVAQVRFSTPGGGNSIAFYYFDTELQARSLYDAWSIR
jgi:hypothetical protein